MLGLRRHCYVLSFGWLPGPCWRELVNSNDLQEESCSRTRPLSCCRPARTCSGPRPAGRPLQPGGAGGRGGRGGDALAISAAAIAVGGRNGGDLTATSADA